MTTSCALGAQQHLLQMGPWLADAVQAAMPQGWQCHRLDAQAHPSDWLAVHGTDVVALTCHSGGMPLTEDVLAQLPNLRMVFNLGSGTDGLDADAVTRRGIALYTGRGLNAVDVAELAMGMMLMLARDMRVADQTLRSGRWNAGLRHGQRIAGLRAGIVGMGQIGQQIATRLQAFGVSVAYYARAPKSDIPWTFVGDVQALAASVDYLFVTLPGTESTHHFINAAVLQALGPSGYLVSVGRGSVVDEAALVQVLEGGEIAGAAMDVFEHEPQVPQALVAQPNTVLLPHRGGATLHAQADVVEQVLQRLQWHCP